MSSPSSRRRWADLNRAAGWLLEQLAEQGPLSERELVSLAIKTAPAWLPQGQDGAPVRMVGLALKEVRRGGQVAKVPVEMRGYGQPDRWCFVGMKGGPSPT